MFQTTNQYTVYIYILRSWLTFGGAPESISHDVSLQSFRSCFGRPNKSVGSVLDTLGTVFHASARLGSESHFMWCQIALFCVLR